MANDKIINFKIDEKFRSEFFQLCESKHLNPSQELRLFVHQKIRQLKGTQILLSEFKERK